MPLDVSNHDVVDAVICYSVVNPADCEAILVGRRN